MVINFKASGINQDIRKLARTTTLINNNNNNKKKSNTKSCEMEYVIGGEKKLTRKLSNRNLGTMTNQQAEYASQS
jgi:hypothetical protein